MPPEALATPPTYTHKLDSFSHGVLTIQVVTRNYPTPGAPWKQVEDPRHLNGHIPIVNTEIERRKNDIDKIDLSHPLLPIAHDCLQYWEAERPLANELCERLDSLKREPRYTESVDQTRGHVQTLEEEINMKDAELERARLELEEANEAKEWLQASVEELRECKQKQQKEIEQLRSKASPQVNIEHIMNMNVYPQGESAGSYRDHCTPLQPLPSRGQLK
jgi:hypothetical protein